MRALKQELEKALHKSRRIALIGVGSELRGDDAAGMLVAKKLSRLKSRKLKVFFGESAPENITGELKEYKPTHIIIVDAAHIGKKSGTVQLLYSKDEFSGFSFSTHKMPLKVMLDYLDKFFNFETIIIGIQPKRLGFMQKPTPDVESATNKVTAAIKQLLA
jgi:hydrogenase 3 maturation protease